jgi:hypothetical protein
MSKAARTIIAFVLVLAILGGSLMAVGCGDSGKAALEMPTFEIFQFQKGATVDFDEATINSAANAEANVKYGTAKAIYPSVWAANQETVANQLFPPPYWKGDGVTTKYAMLASGDQTTVDGTIFATKLSQAEQDKVVEAVNGLFATYDEELAAAKPLEQNTAYGILYMTDNTGTLSNAWKTDAAAWMTALNAWAAANKGGKTFAQLSYADRALAMDSVFAKGNGTINPEYAFWRAMVKMGFMNGNASARWPDKRDAMVAVMYPGKTYAQLDCTQKPRVDGAVWASCNATEQAAVNSQVNGLFNLATEQVNGVTSDNQNIYFYALLSTPSAYVVGGDNITAAGTWLATVSGTPAGSSENTTFYAQILGGQTTWRTMLAGQYFGAASFDNLTDAQKAVVIQADMGMMGLSYAQRADTLPLNQNVLYQTLAGSVGASAADGWAAEVGAGMNRELAFYKWLAYEGLRNSIVVAYYPAQLGAKLTALYPGKAYTALNRCDQGVVNGAVWAALNPYEQGFGGSVISGLWGKVQAEMTDAIAMDQTGLIRGPTGLAASAKSETAVINWKKDVDGGLSVKAAYYRWLAKESLLALKGLGTLIRLSTGEFLIKVTNPNKYMISIDSAQYNFQIAALKTGDKVDTSKVVAADKIWVPAESEVLVKVVAPVKQLDMITWAVLAGKSSAVATANSADVWAQYKDGTPTWIITVDVRVSNDEGGDTKTATLTL